MDSLTEQCKDVKIAHGNADVAELADAPDLGSGVPDVQVQVLSPALLNTLNIKGLRGL